ncbi:discoidin domain-containing protein [Litoribacillus peritrichatus]|uniref:F5/8 type C domain-containing protein n=1 Tax=Litoribacillus peritrichatus TaxID=718191 RepID=A0ABP7MEC3_9GAMM
MKTILKTIALLAVATLYGCGSGGSGSGSGLSSQPSGGSNVIRNLSLPENGATVTASYDADGARSTVDEDKTAAAFWSGNISNDYIQIDFGQTSQITEINVYTNRLTLGGDDVWIFEVSNDGVNWERALMPNDNDPATYSCGTTQLSFGESRVRCVNISPILKARYARLTVTEADASNVAVMRFYEIEVIGK